MNMIKTKNHDEYDENRFWSKNRDEYDETRSESYDHELNVSWSKKRSSLNKLTAADLQARLISLCSCLFFCTRWHCLAAT